MSQSTDTPTYVVESAGQLDLDLAIDRLALTRKMGSEHTAHLLVVRRASQPMRHIILAIVARDTTEGTLEVIETREIGWSSGVTRCYTKDFELDPALKQAIAGQLR